MSGAMPENEDLRRLDVVSVGNQEVCHCLTKAVNGRLSIEWQAWRKSADMPLLNFSRKG